MGEMIRMFSPLGRAPPKAHGRNHPNIFSLGPRASKSPWEKPSEYVLPWAARLQKPMEEIIRMFSPFGRAPPKAHGRNDPNIFSLGPRASKSPWEK
jgi:hypothetical protein